MTSTPLGGYVLLALAMAIVVGTIAERKGYDRISWSLGAVLFWPLALLLIALKPDQGKHLRTCPDCGARDIPYNAPVCRHCGRDERTARA